MVWFGSSTLYPQAKLMRTPTWCQALSCRECLAFSGTIQIAKIPAGAAESFYGVTASVYATGATISGFAHAVTTNYNIAWDKGGAYENDTNLLILPYHIIWNPLMAQPRPCSRLNQPPSFIGNKVPSITF